MDGEKVRSLQLELILLGFRIPDSEKMVFGQVTTEIVSELQLKNGLRVTGIVDPITAELIEKLVEGQQPKRFVVYGRVMTDNRPLVGVRIEAFDVDIRRRDPIINDGIITDELGRYEIFYTSEQFFRAEKYSADLIVCALVDEVGEVSSLIKYNAPAVWMMPDLEVPFKQASKPPEYELIVKELEPILAELTVENINEPTIIDKFADLKKDDIDFLVGETGIDQEKIEFLVCSSLLEKKATERQYQISSEIFYGIARKNGLTDFAGLARTNVADLRTSLVLAGGITENSEDNIISPIGSEQLLMEVVESIRHLATEMFLETPLAEGKPTLAQVVATVLPWTKQQVTLVEAYTNHKGTMEQFWTNLRQHQDFQESGKIEKLQFVLQLGTLTQNNIPLMMAIQNKFQSTKEMVRLDSNELRAFIKQAENDIPESFPGDTKEEKVHLYTERIIGLLQGAFPTETVAQVILKVPDVHLHDASGTSIAKFLNRLTDANVVPKGEKFDICSTHIDTFIDKYGDRIFTDLDGSDPGKVITQVKRLQRLFRVSTSPDTFQSLVESRLNSANDIAQMPLSALKEEFKDKIHELDIELIHRRALAVSSSTLHLALQVYQSVTEINPVVVGSA